MGVVVTYCVVVISILYPYICGAAEHKKWAFFFSISMSYVIFGT